MNISGGKILHMVNLYFRKLVTLHVLKYGLLPHANPGITLSMTLKYHRDPCWIRNSAKIRAIQSNARIFITF